MCIIIIKDNGKLIKAETLKRSAKINPDGLGVTWLDTYETETHRSADWDLLKTKRPYIAHFRMATRGPKTPENTHPFAIGDTGCLLYQNGTVRNLGDDDIVDAQVQADLLSYCDREVWGDILEQTACRWVIIDQEAESYDVFNEDAWTERNGILYSKSNVLNENVTITKDTHVNVAVLLNNTGGLDTHLLSGCKELGEGKTFKRFMNVQDGLSDRIDVSIHEVDDLTLEAMDEVYGKANRKSYSIRHSDKKIYSCWMYLNKDEYEEDDFNYYKNYSI